MKTTTFKDYTTRQLKEPGVNRAWQELEEEFEMLESILKLREKAGMSQDALARKAGISRSVYARLERDGFRNASLAILRKIAEALDAHLVVHIDHKNSPGCAAKQKRSK
jgi:DNA-binding XRE family transcriptional regulator